VFSVSLLEPRLNAERAKDGTLNFTQLIERIKSNIVRMRSEGPSRFGLLFRGITIKKGRIELKDDMTSTHLSIADLSMTTKVWLSQQRASASIKSAEIRVSAPAYPALHGSLKASLAYDQGRVRIDSAEF